jgi:hypothetical protein
MECIGTAITVSVDCLRGSAVPLDLHRAVLHGCQLAHSSVGAAWVGGEWGWE